MCHSGHVETRRWLCGAGSSTFTRILETELRSAGFFKTPWHGYGNQGTTLRCASSLLPPYLSPRDQSRGIKLGSVSSRGLHPMGPLPPTLCHCHPSLAPALLEMVSLCSPGWRGTSSNPSFLSAGTVRETRPSFLLL